MFIFKDTQDTLPAEIVSGFVLGNTKMFDDFWGFVKFVIFFPWRDKKETFKQILGSKDCNFIVIKFNKIKTFLTE